MRSDKKASDKRAYVSPYNHNVFKIPADPRAIQEAHEHDERRTSVPRQLIDLYRQLDAARIKLEEDDRIIDLLMQQRNQIAADIADMEQRVQELEEEKKRCHNV